MREVWNRDAEEAWGALPGRNTERTRGTQGLFGEFRWPCHRRVAHKPHDECTCTNWEGHTGDCLAVNPCPGVKAHPNTMIGRSG